MEQTIKTLEQRLLDRSKNDLNNEVKEAIDPAKTLLNRCYKLDLPLTITVKDERGERPERGTVSAYTVLEELHKAIVAELLPKRQNEDIQKFLAHVENMQQQINELRDLRFD